MDKQDEFLMMTITGFQKTLEGIGDEMKEMKTAIVTLARVEEKQISDRKAIGRIGDEVRMCRIKHDGDTEKNLSRDAELEKRVAKIETISGSRSAITQYILNALTAVGIGIAIWWVKDGGK